MHKYKEGKTYVVLYQSKISCFFGEKMLANSNFGVAIITYLSNVHKFWFTNAKYTEYIHKVKNFSG